MNQMSLVGIGVCSTFTPFSLPETLARASVQSSGHIVANPGFKSAASAAFPTPASPSACWPLSWRSPPCSTTHSRSHSLTVLKPKVANQLETAYQIQLKHAHAHSITPPLLCLNHKSIHTICTHICFSSLTRYLQAVD